ncbi:MAG TPA: diacylglycerol kinase [Steroidobacteraceae bacterium]|nr:diacylglycerol kinase [Steroidobacteraceae bacterium]
MDDLKNQSFATRLRFALAGLGHAIGAERSVRTHLMFLLAVLVALAYLRPAPVWWALVLLISSAVIAAELFNTAIERLADQLQPEVHPQIRIVKDCAAAAVLVLSAGALCVAAALALSLWNTP